MKKEIIFIFQNENDKYLKTHLHDKIEDSTNNTCPLHYPTEPPEFIHRQSDSNNSSSSIGKKNNKQNIINERF